MIIIVAIERHAINIECSRNSGQTREPSLIRFVGMWKTSDVHVEHQVHREARRREQRAVEPPSFVSRGSGRAMRIA